MSFAESFGFGVAELRKATAPAFILRPELPATRRYGQKSFSPTQMSCWRTDALENFAQAYYGYVHLEFSVNMPFRQRLQQGPPPLICGSGVGNFGGWILPRRRGLPLASRTASVHPRKKHGRISNRGRYADWTWMTRVSPLLHPNTSLLRRTRGRAHQKWYLNKNIRVNCQLLATRYLMEAMAPADM